MKYLILLFFLSSAYSAEPILGRKYFKHFLGHVHKSMSKDSTSLTIVQCSHSVKILKHKNLMADWLYVKVGDDKGYIRKDFLTTKRPTCFQEKYPKFYNSIGLDITEMYYWGKLYDQYFQGKSKVR